MWQHDAPNPNGSYGAWVWVASPPPAAAYTPPPPAAAYGAPWGGPPTPGPPPATPVDRGFGHHAPPGGSACCFFCCFYLGRHQSWVRRALRHEPVGRECDRSAQAAAAAAAAVPPARTLLQLLCCSRLLDSLTRAADRTGSRFHLKQSQGKGGRQPQRAAAVGGKLDHPLCSRGPSPPKVCCTRASSFQIARGCPAGLRGAGRLLVRSCGPSWHTVCARSNRRGIVPL